jgi:hypothetical protein
MDYPRLEGLGARRSRGRRSSVARGGRIAAADGRCAATSTGQLRLRLTHSAGELLRRISVSAGSAFDATAC